MVSYTALRLDAMLQKKDWSITQQMIVADIEQIKEPKPFNELTNISLALQINKKREKLVAFDPNAEYMNPDDYRRLESNIDMDLILKYLTVQGMYEIKDKNSFRPLNKSLNEDSQTWKPYDTQIRKN